jgi:HD-like signal output (HDOD) protein
LYGSSIDRNLLVRQLPEKLRALLCAFHNAPVAVMSEPQILIAAEILIVANVLDEAIELLPLEPKPMSAVWRDVEEIGRLVQPRVLEALRKVLPSSQYAVDANNLPIQLNLVRDLLAMIKVAEPDFVEVAQLASRDPVIAASFLQVANSALYARRNEIRTIRQAITYLGLDASRQLMMALALRPVFASSQLQNLWRHAVWMGDYLRSFAAKYGIMDTDEALLLGLVHDIGRIASQKIPKPLAALGVRLIEGGCPITYTEQLLFGMDHGEIGAGLLLLMGCPDDIVEAVRFHHRPAMTDSILASALYLAEYWADTDEDLPSMTHLNAALAKIPCSARDLSEVQTQARVFQILLHVA